MRWNEPPAPVATGFVELVPVAMAGYLARVLVRRVAVADRIVPGPSVVAPVEVLPAPDYYPGWFVEMLVPVIVGQWG